MMILLWLGVRNLFDLILTLDYGFILTTTNKALTIGLGALLIASTIEVDASTDLIKSSFDRTIEKLALMAPLFMGFFYLPVVFNIFCLLILLHLLYHPRYHGLNFGLIFRLQP
jgi:hypothetical protein